MRLSACTLHLRTCGEDRDARSAEHKDTIIAMLQPGSISAADCEDLLGAVTNPQLAPSPPWNVADLQAIAQAVESAKQCARRRQTQDFMNALEFFTQSEWESWKSMGSHGSEIVVHEMIARMKSIQGKNLDEHSKKLLTATWLFLRGDGKEIGTLGRLKALEAFKMRWARATRDYEPDVYIMKLPSLNAFQQDHPEVFADAFPAETPYALPRMDMAAVRMLDGMLRCRGIGIGIGETPGLGQQLAMPQSIAQQNATNVDQQMQQVMQLALQQFAGLVRQPSGDIPVQFLGNQPQGRPMRSLGYRSAQNGLSCAQRAAFEPPHHGASPLADRLSSAGSSDSLGQEDAARPPAFAPPAQPDAFAPPSLRPTVAPTLRLSSAVAPEPSVPAMLALQDKSDDGIAAVMARMASKRTRKRRREGDEQVVKKKKKVGKKGGKKSNEASEATTRATSSDLPSAMTQATPKKTKKEAAATPKKTKKGAASLPPTPAKSTWKQKPRIEWESSRNQVMCRTGKGGPGSSHRIGFKESGGPTKAWTLAEKWLSKQMALWKAATGKQ